MTCKPYKNYLTYYCEIQRGNPPKIDTDNPPGTDTLWILALAWATQKDDTFILNEEHFISLFDNRFVG